MHLDQLALQFYKGFGHSIFADRPVVFADFFKNILRAKAHQGNWQLQRNHNFRERCRFQEGNWFPY
jgi:hypothetical protein